jgi:hypothetical protein
MTVRGRSHGPLIPAFLRWAPETTRRHTLRNLALFATVLLAAATAACGGDSKSSSETPASTLPQGSGQVELDPADFTTTIDNPYWPIAPGNRWVYRELDSEGGTKRVVVTVTRKTKTIMGIEARVVHDVVGDLVEDTFDWYAQDADGNIGIWASTRGSTRARSRPPRAPGRPASTARRPGSSSPRRREWG